MATHKLRLAEVDAIHWTGDNKTAMATFCGFAPTYIDDENGGEHALLEAYEMAVAQGEWLIKASGTPLQFYIKTDAEFTTEYRPL